jgi:hypothetical protein
MKWLILFISFIFLFGCKSNSTTEPNIKYSGYYIPIEGGKINMHLDSITPMNELIKRLEVENRLYETGKAYLIGFNDLMFSIAVHSTKAIQQLLDYIDTTRSYDARIAAIYTLYLIGIDCKVIWRPYDEFTNIKAREALFKILAEDSSMQIEIMLLLIRDPRESDIPRLFNILESTTSDCWSIISGLLRYDLKNIPVKQEIPDSLYSMKIVFPKQKDDQTYHLVGDIFFRFAQKYPDLIRVEGQLFHYDDSCWVRDNEVYIRELTNWWLTVRHGMIGANYQYVYKDGKILFCSASTAKHLWVDWWHSQSTSFKDSLKSGYKKIGIDRI